jgi:hypothetical protein
MNSFHHVSHGVLELFHWMAERGEPKKTSQKAMAWSSVACRELAALAMVKEV